MEGVDRDTALRVEKVRIRLDFGAREFESHRQNHLIAFTGFFGAGLASVGSMAFERVSTTYGLPFAAAMFLGAGYTQARVRLAPRRLWRAYRQGTRIIEILISLERK